MTEDLREKFIERFGFVKESLSSEYSMPYPFQLFQFECEDGWFDLLWTLCEGIEAELPNLDCSEPFRVVQVKEKFGTLRFYTNWESPAIGDLIEQAEKTSAVTCEICGNLGELSGEFWVTTLCEEHKKESL